MSIPLLFQSRRQNTGQGLEQIRIWTSPEETNKLAQHIPELNGAVQLNSNWQRKIGIYWLGGKSPPMILAAYKNQGGCLSFTAAKITPLFDFARKMLTSKTPFPGTYNLSADGHSDAIEFKFKLP